jgi:hypothetical protein
MKTNGAKILLFFVIFVILLTGCQNDSSSNSTGESNTEVKSIKLPIEYDPSDPKHVESLFWLSDQRVLIFTETFKNSSYLIYDYSEEKIIDTGSIPVKMNSNAAINLVISEIDKNHYLITNRFDLKEFYLWQNTDGNVNIRPIIAEDIFPNFSINKNIVFFAGIPSSSDSVQLYKIQEENTISLMKEKSISLSDLGIPENGKLFEIAFVNENDFVYRWTTGTSTSISSCGVYSLDKMKIKTSSSFGSSFDSDEDVKLLKRGDSVFLEKNPNDRFVFFNANGEAYTIEGMEADNVAIPPLLATSTGEWLAYNSDLTYRDDETFTWTVLKPTDLATKEEWIIEKPYYYIPDDDFCNVAIAITKEKEPELVFISKSRPHFGNPDSWALYVVSRK